ncbi:MAG: toxin-antitoxin system HicB family antitoxin [Phormidesmis sp.]
MSKFIVRLPESLHSKIKELAKAEGISINQFLVMAAAEKMPALLTKDFLEHEAKQSKREDFERFLKKVPDVEPEAYDRID